MRSLGHLRVRWYAIAASRSFSKTVRCAWACSAFLTNCWAIVEPPWAWRPCTRSWKNARARGGGWWAVGHGCEMRSGGVAHAAGGRAAAQGEGFGGAAANAPETV